MQSNHTMMAPHDDIVFVTMMADAMKALDAIMVDLQNQYQRLKWPSDAHCIALRYPGSTTVEWKHLAIERRVAIADGATILFGLHVGWNQRWEGHAFINHEADDHVPLMVPWAAMVHAESLSVFREHLINLVDQLRTTLGHQ